MHGALLRRSSTLAIAIVLVLVLLPRAARRVCEVPLDALPGSDARFSSMTSLEKADLVLPSVEPKPEVGCSGESLSFSPRCGYAWRERVKSNLCCTKHVDSCTNGTGPFHGSLLFTNDVPSLGHIGFAMCGFWTALMRNGPARVRRVAFLREQCKSTSGDDLNGPWMEVIKPLIAAMVQEAGKRRSDGVLPVMQFFDTPPEPEPICYQTVEPVRIGVCETRKSAFEFRDFIRTHYNLPRRIVGLAFPFHLTLLVRLHDRRFVNLAEVLGMINATFSDSVELEVVDFGDRGSSSMPLQKQLEVLSRTDILITMHGAAEALVFALPPNAVLVEVVPPGFFFYLFNQLSQQLGIVHLMHFPDGNSRCNPLKLLSKRPNLLHNGAHGQECLHKDVVININQFRPVILDAIMRVATARLVDY